MAETVTKGTIVQKEGKYFLEVAGKSEALPTGLLTDEAFLKEQVGKEMEVFFTIPKSFVAAIRPVGRPQIITCNIPAVEFLRGETFITQPTPAMTRSVATALLKGGFINQETFNQILG
jgi:hypothetical protein